MGIPVLVVRNVAVNTENQANWEAIIGFNRAMGDRVCTEIRIGFVGFVYELAHFDDIAQVDFAERNLLMTSFGHPPSPTIVTRS